MQSITGFSASKHLAEGLTLKLLCTVKVASEWPSGCANTNGIQNRWATNFAFKIFALIKVSLMIII